MRKEGVHILALLRRDGVEKQGSMTSKKSRKQEKQAAVCRHGTPDPGVYDSQSAAAGGGDPLGLVETSRESIRGRGAEAPSYEVIQEGTREDIMVIFFGAPLEVVGGKRGGGRGLLVCCLPYSLDH